MIPPLVRSVALPGVDPRNTLRFLRFSALDPTASGRGGVLWKGLRTPEGPATLCVEVRPFELRALGWGPGAPWALARVHALAGADDDPSALVPRDARIAHLVLRTRGMRLPRAPWVFEYLAGVILQQRVTFEEAARSWRQLVEALGEPAPSPAGPDEAGDRYPRLWVAPEPARLARMSPTDLRPFGVDAQRAGTLIEAAFHARRIDALIDAPLADADALLRQLPGCGPWTRGMLRGFALGDPDAIPLGDVHLPHTVGAALLGDPTIDEARMLELLDPYVGQRFRVLRMILCTS